MKADFPSIPPDKLISDLEWLSRLARRLVSDPDLADDACQEAWLLASRNAGGAGLDRRSLVGFLRSYVWRARRSSQRRKAREAQVARPDRLPSTEELLLIGERQQELWRHLSELPEPYRSTLLLHFQQGIAVSALAKRKGVPVDTLRWRLRRGLQLLKESLERDDEGPRLMGLMPVAVSTLNHWKPFVASETPGLVGSAAVQIGSLLMMKTLLLAVGALVLLVLGWTQFRDSDVAPLVRSQEPELEGQVASSAPSLPAEPNRELDPGESGERLPGVIDDPGELFVAQAWSLEVTVLQPDGEVAVGADVMIAVGALTQSLGVTGDDGRLACPLPSLDARGFALWDSIYKPKLFVSHPNFAPVEAELSIEAFEAPGQWTVTLTLAGAPCLRGRVVGSSGSPMRGARCALWQLHDGEGAALVRSTLSNSEGSFALAVAPGERGFVMVETNTGRACTETFDIGVAGDIGLIYIEELERISGRVVDPNGEAATGIQVYFQMVGLSNGAQLRGDGSFASGFVWGSTSTDTRGRFEFLGVRPGTYVVSVRTGAEGGDHKLEVTLPCADLTLTAPHPRLRVFVRDVNGVAASGIRIHMRELDAPPGQSPKGWFRSTDERGVFAATVTNGATYALVGLGRFGSPEEQVVHIPETGFQHEAHLLIGESSRVCDLRVNFVEPGGAERQDFSVLIRTLPSYLSLEEEERSPGPDGLLANLPQGRFSLKLFSEIDPGEDHYLFLEEDEQTVELSPGVTPEVSFELLRGAHLEVVLGVDRWPDDSSTCPPESDEAGRAAWLRQHKVSIQIGESFEDGGGLRAEYPHSLLTFDEHRPWSPSERWVPGTTTRNWAVLKPGRYAYRVTGGAWHTVHGVFELRAGETTAINVALSAR